MSDKSSDVLEALLAHVTEVVAVFSEDPDHPDSKSFGKTFKAHWLEMGTEFSTHWRAESRYLEIAQTSFAHYYGVKGTKKLLAALPGANRPVRLQIISFIV